MEKNLLSKSIIILCLMIISASCNKKQSGDGSLTQIKTDGGNILTVCDFNKVNDTVTYKLSDFVKDFKIVRFENSDKAIFKLSGWPIVTDNYIGIKQSRRPFLLFDHNGKLVCEVGSIGGGPGEYTSLYDEVINEELGKIYLSPFANSSKVLEYNIDGKFVKDIVTKSKLNKPKIDVTANGDITIIQMPFTVNENHSLVMQYDNRGKLKKELIASGALLINPFDASGNFVGFNNEVLSFRNTSNFDFMLTACDTLFHYQKDKNKISPKFTIDFGGIKDVPWHMYNEIPAYYLSFLYKKGVIIVDKKKHTSSYLKVINDFFGNIDAPSFNFNKGWFYQMFEPSTLMEIIENKIADNNCSTADRQKLTEILNSLNENDNNLMFIARLK